MAGGRDTMPPSERQAVIVGAGIIGVCCALYLQRDGWAVTLVDEAAPGEGCSAGNAGVIVGGAVAPLAYPGIFRDLPTLLTDPDSPLAIRWRYLLPILPWLARFARASTEDVVEAGTVALTSLVKLIPDAYAPLIASAGAGDLLRSQGQLFVYQSSAALERARPGFVRRQRHSTSLVEIGPAEIRQAEPALAAGLAGGWYRSEGSHLRDPRRFTETLAADFVRRGGTLRRAMATGLLRNGRSVHGVQTTQGPIEGAATVVAAGARSGRFVKELGMRVPLDTERGYAVTLPHPGFELRLPVSVGEGGFFMTPMEGGLRLAGTVEFGGLAPPPDPRRYEAIMRRARKLFPALDESGAIRWMGCRPSLPDTIPVIAAAPGWHGAYFAFGHGHLGMSLGAVTGKLIAELAGNVTPSVNLAPFRADRF